MWGACATVTPFRHSATFLITLPPVILCAGHCMSLELRLHTALLGCRLLDGSCDGTGNPPRSTSDASSGGLGSSAAATSFWKTTTLALS